MFLGATGSGKTVLAKKLLSGLNRVIVIDPKHTFSLDNFSVLRHYKMPFFISKFQYIIRPIRGDDLKLRNLIEKVIRDGSITIYVDELASLVDRFPLTTETLEDIARTGRESYISLWSASQRPRWIPKPFLTETESIFQFGLRAFEDRQYLSGFTGSDPNKILGPYEFIYSRADANTPPEKMILNLQTGKIISLGKEN